MPKFAYECIDVLNADQDTGIRNQDSEEGGTGTVQDYDVIRAGYPLRLGQLEASPALQFLANTQLSCL